MQYYGTMLPRIPVLIERKMKVQLLLHEVSVGSSRRRFAVFRMIGWLDSGLIGWLVYWLLG